MFKHFFWGVILFIINIFMLFQNYNKDFSLSTSFFIESNQMIALIIGIMYSQQCRKFNLKHIFGIACNSLVFSVLVTILFAIYEVPVNIIFTMLAFASIFVCIFISYTLYYWLFCPDKYKSRYRKRKQKKAEKIGL